MANLIFAFLVGYFGYVILIRLIRKRRRRIQLAKIKELRRSELQGLIRSIVIIPNELLMMYSDVITQEELNAYKIIQNGQALDFLAKYNQYERDINFTLDRLDQLPYSQRASVIAKCELGLKELDFKRAFLMIEVLGLKLN
jgi:hypothetical protein